MIVLCFLRHMGILLIPFLVPFWGVPLQRYMPSLFLVSYRTLGLVNL